LLEQIYGFEGDVGLNTIEVYIHRLRKKVVGSGVSLRTVHGRGYALEIDDSHAPVIRAAAATVIARTLPGA
jgi:DNA-binding response OmpR family regulator